MTDTPTTTRRGFIRAGIAAGGALAAAAGAARAGTPDPLITEVQDWASGFGDPVDATPYGMPIEFESHVVRRNVEWLTESPVSSINFTPIHALEGTITPQGCAFRATSPRRFANAPRTAGWSGAARSSRAASSPRA
jgi:sulfane dehydrogenase subunit SoxC